MKFDFNNDDAKNINNNLKNNFNKYLIFGKVIIKHLNSPIV